LNGRIRDYYPRGADFNYVLEEAIDAMVGRPNDDPGRLSDSIPLARN